MIGVIAIALGLLATLRPYVFQRQLVTDGVKDREAAEAIA